MVDVSTVLNIARTEIGYVETPVNGTKYGRWYGMHFPTEQAALKCLYLVNQSLNPTGRGRARWVVRWKAALNAFDLAFEGRLTPSTTH